MGRLSIWKEFCTRLCKGEPNETVESLRRERDLELSPGETRRNIMPRGVRSVDATGKRTPFLKSSGVIRAGDQVEGLCRCSG